MRDCARSGQQVAGLARCPHHPGPWQDSRDHYADILGHLEPVNKGRDKRDRITYDSLRVHAKRLGGHLGALDHTTLAMRNFHDAGNKTTTICSRTCGAELLASYT